MNNPLQLSLVNFKKGAYIIVEGKQKADCFYIIRSGKVSISKEVEVVEEEGGNILAPGDFFGVVSTMSSHSHIETAQAITDVTLIAVRREQYGLLIERNAPVAMKIIQQFSKKMRYLDAALARLTLKSGDSEDIAHLFRVAEYYARQSQYNLAYYAYHQYIVNSPRGQNVNLAKERMAKIQPYAKAVYLDIQGEEFTRSYPKNTMIFSEAQPGKEMYIIQKGSVKITKIQNDNEVMLALLKAGDMFGEMSLLEDKPRSASAIAHEDTVLMAVNKANFTRMVSNQPQLISKLTQILSERIWFIYKQLANTQLSDPVGRLYDALLIQLEKLRIPISSEAYTFDLGPRELGNMVGLPKEELNLVLQKLFQNSKVKIVDNHVYVSDIEEIEKQAKYYRKMEKIEKARRQGSMNLRK
ncbi:Crp/Fnr family transcriptional regulator [Marispirochaeta aestuarii]|uniref:cAMP-binding protein n=1 Tax=Marispirochaeta aestuarii TaxID=1963862 RepID=A0A1Y1RUQ4_9SPIO|nr:cyclic nucleotide-binding domain-containing protein [Marispirochaeta aestuarii]ORC32808.1 cAMP-binding protein [Marispirochaeta aestuarii]